MSAHRGDTDESWRIDRLNDAFDTACRLIVALGPDAPTVHQWDGALLEMYEKKGDLAVEWDSPDSKRAFSWAVEAAWRAQSEYSQVTHMVRPLEEIDIPY